MKTFKLLNLYQGVREAGDGTSGRGTGPACRTASRRMRHLVWRCRMRLLHRQSPGVVTAVDARWRNTQSYLINSIGKEYIHSA